MSALTTEIFITFADGDGDETTRVFEVPSTVAITDLTPLTTALLGLITPLITGAFRKAGFTVSVTVPALVAQATADVQELMVIGARTTNNFLKRMNVATIDEAKVFVAGTKEADRGDADVDAFLTALTNGIDISGAGGSGVVEFSDGRGEDLTTIEYAREEFSS